MKPKLNNLIKTRSPIKGKISNVIKEKILPKNSKKVIPSSMDLPSKDLENTENNSSKAYVPDNKNEISDKTDSKVLGTVDSIKNMIKNVLNQNSSTTNNKYISNFKNINQNTVNKNVQDISSLNNKDVMNSMIQNFSSIKNGKDKTNYVNSSINIPFMTTKNDTPNSIKSDRSLESAVLETNKKTPAFIETTNNFYNPSKGLENIKAAKPKQVKFPEVLNTNNTSYHNKNDHFTNRVKNNLQSAEVKIFTTKGNTVKSTKNVIDHIRTRQNNVIPMLQYGGVVNQPTLAMVGENGPEMVSPMKTGGGDGFGSMLDKMNPFSAVTESVKNAASSININQTGQGLSDRLQEVNPFSRMSEMMESINSSALGSGPKNLQPPGPSDSITAMTNQSLQESASHRADSTASGMNKGYTEPVQTLSTAGFGSSSPSKQTAPSAGTPGAAAGSSPFASYFRAKMFSLPDWRSRLS